MEGTLQGVFNEMSSLNGVPEDTSYVLKHIDEIGGPSAYNHFPVGWAWAMNTPFQWGKQIASHFGGTRNPVVISWPARIKDRGGIRTQFHHVIDIVPTILEAANIPAPTELNGVPQKPIEGISIVYSFDDAKAKAQRHTQYFEMFGNRALYHDGWIAVSRHGRLPWENARSYDFAQDTWELYDVEHDFNEANNLAAQHPERLQQLQDLFLVEAKKYNVLPLDDRFIERADPSLRPSLIEGRTSFTYYAGATRIPESSAVNTKNRSHTITATIAMPKQGGDGVLVAAGGTVAGYTLYIKDRKPTYEYNWFSQVRYKVTSAERLREGPVTIRVVFVSDSGVGKGGKVELYVNDRKVSEGRVEKTVPGRFSADETFDIGMDTGSPVSTAYKSPNSFTGTLKQVTFDLKPIPPGMRGAIEQRERQTAFRKAMND
jgi:arylsulfatase